MECGHFLSDAADVYTCLNPSAFTPNHIPIKSREDSRAPDPHKSALFATNDNIANNAVMIRFTWDITYESSVTTT
jgi:hypothetical protein